MADQVPMCWGLVFNCAHLYVHVQFSMCILCYELHRNSRNVITAKGKSVCTQSVAAYRGVGKSKYFTVEKSVSHTSMLSKGGAIFILCGAIPVLGGAILILGGALPILGDAVLILGGGVPILVGATPILYGALPILGGAIPILVGAIPILGGAIPILGGAIRILGGAIPILVGGTPTLGDAILILNSFSIYKKVIAFFTVCYCPSNTVHQNTLRISTYSDQDVYELPTAVTSIR